MTSILRKVVQSLIVASLFLASVTWAWAATTGTVPVRAVVKVVEECSFSSQSLDLDLYSMQAFGGEAKATLSMSCRSNVSPVAFGVSIEGGVFGERIDGLKMKNSEKPNGFLPYSMAVSPAAGTLEGESSQPLELLVLLDKPGDNNQDLSGNYEDLVTVTVVH